MPVLNAFIVPHYVSSTTPANTPQRLTYIICYYCLSKPGEWLNVRHHVLLCFLLIPLILLFILIDHLKVGAVEGGVHVSHGIVVDVEVVPDGIEPHDGGSRGWNVAKDG